MPRLCLEWLEPRALPATVFWNVNADGFWDVTTNWRDDQGVSRLPSPADDVVLERPANITITLRTDATVRSLTSHEAFTLAAGSALTLLRDSLFAATEAPTTLQNAGSVRVQGGTLTVSGSGVSTGVFQVDTGATLTFRNTHEFRSGTRVLGSGLVRMEGANFHSFRVTNTLVLENFALAGGNVHVAGSLQVLRQMTWSTGILDGLGVTNLPGAATLHVTDTAFIKRLNLGHTLDIGGTLRFTGNTINLEVLGTLNLQRAATLQVDVQNLVRFMPPSQGGTIHNAGRVEVVRGAFDLGQRGGTSSGTYHAAAGAQIVLPRPHRFTDGAAFTGPGLKTLSGTVNLTGNITGENVQLTGTLTGTHTLTGAFIWQTGSITGEGTTTVTAGSTFMLGRADETLALTGGHVLHNAGSTILVASATLNVTADSVFSNAGAVIVEANSLLALEGLYTQTEGRTRLNGGGILTPLLNLQGGVLEGTGFVVGDVLNASRLDVGGAGQAGMLAIYGNYTQTAAGSLGLEIGGLEVGSQYDNLHVEGIAVLDGTLSLGLLDGFVPSANDLFLILSFGTRTGDFTMFEGLVLGDDRAFLPFSDETGYYLWTYLL